MLRELEICTQLHCPVGCTYCPREAFYAAYRTGYADRPARMTTGLLAECLRSVPKSVVINFCSFTEPFANRECLDLMVVADALGFTMSLCTTLDGLSDRDLRRLLRYRFHRVIYHVPTEDGHMNVQVDDAYVLNAATFVAEVSCDHFDMLAFGPVNHKLNGFLSPRQEVPHTRAGALAPSGVYHKGPLPHCYKLYNGHLLPNGDVILCCMDWKLQHVLGNLTQQTYQQIYEGEAFKSVLRKRALDDCPDLLCRTCDHNYGD